jgi:hypothetical protein
MQAINIYLHHQQIRMDAIADKQPPVCHCEQNVLRVTVERIANMMMMVKMQNDEEEEESEDDSV